MPSSLSTRPRRALALLLTLLAAVSAPAGQQTTARRGDTPPALAQTPDKSGYAGNVLVIYRDATGASVCREARADEKQSLGAALRGGALGDDAAAAGGIIYAGGGASGVVRSSGEGAAAAAQQDALAASLLPSAGLHIVLHGTSQLQQNPAARDAFIVAANRWEALISTQMTVVLDVDYGTTFFGQPFSSPNVIGATGTSETTRRFSTVRQQLLAAAPGAEESTLYNSLPASSVPVELNGVAASTGSARLAAPVARALGLIPDITNPDVLTINQGDAGIGFNSAFSFDFNPDDGITPGQTDFDAVVVHEIGHALGFSSESGANSPGPVSLLDLFRFRPGAGSLPSLATAPRVMSTGGAQVFYSNRPSTEPATGGRNELGLSTGGPSGDQGDGEQSSHWKADEQTGVRIGIMDPTLSSGRRETISSNDLLALDTFGYKIGGSPVLPPPAPAPAPPANDNFVNGVVLQGASGSIGGANFDSTAQAGEPDPSGGTGRGNRSVWYFWTAPSSGTVTMDTLGSDYDTTLGAYTGTTVGALSVVAENDDINTQAGNIRSRITFNATVGTTYRIMVNGWGSDTGSFILNWTVAGAPGAAITVSGFIRDAQNNPIPGVGYRVTGLPAAQFVNADGSYLVTITPTAAAPVTITPSKYGYTFTPASATFSSTAAGSQTVNFTGTLDNPIDASPLFVAQHYRDFLGREPDAAGLNFWTLNIEQCLGSVSCSEVSRVNTSAAFFLSIEFQETGGLVYRMWKTAYANIGTTPIPVRRQQFLEDTAVVAQNVQVGVGNWQQQLETNKATYANLFAARAVFKTKYDTMSNAEFVDTLNQNAEGALSGDERNGLVAALNGGTMTRPQVLRAVAEDATLRQSQLRRAFVLTQYFGYLRRDPDAPDFQNNPDPQFLGYNFWLGKLNEFNGNYEQAEMVKAFITSIEYRRRFGQ